MKKIMNTLTLLLALQIVFCKGFAQIQFSEKQIKGNNYFVKMGIGNNLKASLQNEELLLRQITESNPSIQFKLVNSYTDDFTFTHKKFNVFYKEIQVIGMDFAIHEKNGVLQYANGTYEKFEPISAEPKISDASAKESAKSFLETSMKSKMTGKSIIENKGFVIIKNPLYKNAKYELAFKIIVESENLSGKYVFVSAANGSIIAHKNLGCSFGNEGGLASTRYSGQRTFTTDKVGNQHRLREVSPNGVNIKTLNANNVNDYANAVASATDFWDTDGLNNWEANEHGDNQVATDAHWAMEWNLNYWLGRHNRNSFNGLGGDVVSYVRFKHRWDDAVWIPEYNAMFFGDGDFRFRPLTCLDVCAHEFGHGIAQYTANFDLLFGTESQALGEGFSDIWGACVEAYVDKRKFRWLIGEEITKGAPFFYRSMSNPPSGSTPSPDTYGDAYWNNNPDGHYRNGVLNKWFYLVSEGGSGTNGHGNNYNVSGIGIFKAEKIAYRTEQILNSNADYAMARTISIQAAQELYPGSTVEVNAVINAWCAVGVGTGCCFNATTPIYGPNSQCSEAIYSINLPAGNTVTWATDHTPPVVVEDVVPPIAPYNKSVRVKAMGYSGPLVLTANITSNCGTTPSTKNIEINAGTAPSCSTRTAFQYVNGYQTTLNKCQYMTQWRYVDGNPMHGQEYYTTAWVVDPTAITVPDGNGGTLPAIEWQFVSASGNSSYLVNPSNPAQVEVFINFHPYNGWIRLKCITRNLCGSYSWDFWFTHSGSTASCPVTFDFNCINSEERSGGQQINSSKISLSPNPTNGQFKVLLSGDIKDAQIREVRVKNKMGVEVYRQLFKNAGREQTINLKILPTDIYIVEVFDGKKWLTEKLSLQR